MARVLIVDADPQIRRFLGVSLGTCGHRVVEADSVAAGLRLGLGHKFDLIILEPGLADMNGQEAITAIRRRSTVPIIVLSACADEANKVEALDRGANDYVVKPFGIGELMARVRAALRRPDDGGEPERLRIGGLMLDFARRVVTRDGREVHLSKKEYDLLHLLGRHADYVLTHGQILKEVWGPAHADDLGYLRVYVNQLRQKLEEDPGRPRLILTEPGVGYRLKTTE